jgi:hypothetical protein
MAAKVQNLNVLHLPRVQYVLDLLPLGAVLVPEGASRTEDFYFFNSNPPAKQKSNSSVPPYWFVVLGSCKAVIE